MEPILEVSHLKKYFATKRGMLHAVDDINFKINPGETLGVVGESGCGKTTLGRTILHMTTPTSGSVIFDGKNYENPTKAELKELREKMQIIFQDPYSSLNPRMSVSETIMEPLKLKGGMSKKELLNRTAELMDTVGIALRFANSYPHELDGGRRQRIGVARALALNPKFIVCDEPVSALDVSIQAQIINLLLDLQDSQKITYIFITHDLSVVKYISDNILVMYLGQMVEMAPAGKLFESPLHPYTKALLSAIPIPNVHNRKKRIIMQGEITSPINPLPGCRFKERCPYATEECDNPQTAEEILPNHFVSCCRCRSINQL